MHMETKHTKLGYLVIKERTVYLAEGLPVVHHVFLLDFTVRFDLVLRQQTDTLQYSNLTVKLNAH